MEDWEGYDDYEIVNITPRNLRGIYPPEMETLPDNSGYFLQIRLDQIEGDCLESQFLFRTMSCEVTVNGISQSSRFSISGADGQTFRTRREDRKDLVWRFFDFYGPTPIKFKIVENGIFTSIDRASGLVTLKSLQNAESNRNSSSLATTGDNNAKSKWGVEYNLLLARSSQVHPLSYTAFTYQAPRQPVPVSNCTDKESFGFYENTTTVSPVVASSSKQEMIVKVKFHFRIINIRDCLRLLPHLSDGPGRKEISEFHYALEHSALPLIKQLMLALSERGSLRQCLEIKNSSGHNALAIALLAKNVPVVRLLLSRAGIWCFHNTQQMESCALHHCIEGGSYECFTILLRFLRRYISQIVGWTNVFADMMDWCDGAAMTPLALACSKPNMDTVVKDLLRAGANCRGLNKFTQRTAFMNACEAGNLIPALMLLSIEKTRRELRLDGNLPLENNNSTTTNQTIAGGVGGSINQSLLLARKLCRPADRDISGITAMMLAAAGGHAELVEILLTLGVALSSTSDSGDTIFHFAAKGGNQRICQMLVERETLQWRAYRADVKEKSVLQSMRHRPKMMLVRNHRGFQPYQIACQQDHQEVADYLATAAKKIYAVKKNENALDQWDVENVDDYYGNHLDDVDYAFAMQPTPPALGPNNYYATAAAMAAAETNAEGDNNNKEVSTIVMPKDDDSKSTDDPARISTDHVS